MNRIIIMKLITRQVTINKQQLHTTTRLFNQNDSSSSSESDSDNEKLKGSGVKKNFTERDEETKKETLNLLNSLLTQMSTNEIKRKTVDRAIPIRKPLPKPIPKPTLEEKLMGAAKDAAASLGGDVKQTEADLLTKMFSAGAPTSKITTQSESTASSKSNLSNLLTSMKIDRTSQATSSSHEELPRSRSSKVQQLAERFQNIDMYSRKSKYSSARSMDISGNLYEGTRFNIFNPTIETTDDSEKLKTWNLLEEKELKLMLIHPPENIFEEMIQWTEKGMLWKFPIDNEIGMEEEHNIHFSEHVFMERHLQHWCPKKGPIRYFMELVCVGLSKNPYMTVEEKKNHIMWYREFFGSKQELLKEVGAIENDILPCDTTTKQIET